MNKPRIPRTPARSLAAVAAVTLALLAGWAVFRVAGRGALDARLQNRQGDPAALQGFTLLGQVQHLNADAVTTFTLEDGEFRSETRLDTNTLAGATNWDYQLYSGTNWTIDPADRAAVNAAAVPDGDTLTSTAPRLVWMETLFLPDGTEARFPIATWSEETPVTAYWDPVDEEWTDWCAFDVTDTEAELRPDQNLVPWQGRYCLTLPRSTDLQAAGIYRVEESLTEAEARAQLPAVPVGTGGATAAETAPYGRVQLFYTPENAVFVSGCLPVGDLLAVTWLDEAGTLSLDLVNGDGQRVDRRTLAEQVSAETLRITPLPRQRPGEAGLLVRSQGPNGGEQAQLVVMRAENGRLTVYCQCPLTAQDTLPVFAALDDTGTRLLQVDRKLEVWDWEVRGYHRGASDPAYELRVQDLDDGAVLFTAGLTAGDWAWGTHRPASLDRLDALSVMQFNTQVWFPHLTDEPTL